MRQTKLDCPECGIVTAIKSRSKEDPEFCPFCGETAILIRNEEEDDEVQDYYE